MKILALRIFYVLLAIVALVSAMVGIEYFGGQPMGLFSGSRPANLGFSAGTFSPPTWKPNCVSSTVGKSDSHYVEPLAFSGRPNEAWKRLQTLVRGSPRINVVTDAANYLHAEYKSAGMGFIDDVEFALDKSTNVIQVRSASRLGVRDFGVNRARVESLRAQFSK
jgi:uncharacterized protein (DUF1499 family)